MRWHCLIVCYQIVMNSTNLLRLFLFLLLCVVVNSGGRRFFRRRKKIIKSEEVPSEDILNLPKVERNGWVDPCFYFSMESILQVWHDATVQFPNTKVMRSLFINKCFTSPTVWDDREADRSRQPFINIESNSPKTRDAAAKALAARMGGQYLENPPKCLASAWYLYRSRTHELHRPYYALGLYGLSHAVKVHWVRKPVVMTGYWFDRMATTMADLFEEVPPPPETSAVYKFPQDMIKPDLTVFLDMGDLATEELEDPNISEERPSGWVSRYTNIFRTFPNNHNIQTVTWKGESADNVTESLLQLIQAQLRRTLEKAAQK